MVTSIKKRERTLAHHWRDYAHRTGAFPPTHAHTRATGGPLFTSGNIRANAVGRGRAW